MLEKYGTDNSEVSTFCIQVCSGSLMTLFLFSVDSTRNGCSWSYNCTSPRPFPVDIFPNQCSFIRVAYLQVGLISCYIRNLLWRRCNTNLHCTVFLNKFNSEFLLFREYLCDCMMQLICLFNIM